MFHEVFTFILLLFLEVHQFHFYNSASLFIYLYAFSFPILKLSTQEFPCCLHNFYFYAMYSVQFHMI